jgi:hypothetical protein
MSKRVLIPELPASAIVVMDNLSSHKGPRVREMIEAAGATLLYLPLQPDRERLRKAHSKSAKGCRTHPVGGLWDTVGRIIDTYTPAESSNYFAAAGY